jgi:hypothetical protein
MIDFSKYASNKLIKDLKPLDKNLEMRVILISEPQVNKLKNGQTITQFLVADESGSIYCNFYDISEWKSTISEGDILFLKGAYATIYNTNLILYSSKPGFGKVLKIGEFFMHFSPTPNISLIDWKKEKDDKTGLDYYVVDNSKLII